MLDRQLGENLGLAIDYLVDALGEASCGLRRAIIMLDISAHPMTTQAEIIQRLSFEKSLVSRNVQWLEDHGIVVKFPCAEDARELRIQLTGFSESSVQYALQRFRKPHDAFIKFLRTFHESFTIHNPTLRDIKILCVVNIYGKLTRQQIRDELYNGSLATYNRAITHLIEEGLIAEKSYEVD